MGEMRQIEFVLSQAELKIGRGACIDGFQAAGQIILVACDCKAASTELLSKLNKGVVVLYRAYKMLGLLPDAVREAIYAAEEWCDKQRSPFKATTILKPSRACCQAWSTEVYSVKQCMANIIIIIISQSFSH
eukprot:Em0017g660a